MRSISWVVLHSAASYDWKRREVVHLSMQAVDRYHRDHNGWQKIGYHHYVCEDGKGERGREDHEVGAHVATFNRNSLGICVSGHGDFAPWNQAQTDEVLRKCAQWCRMYRVPVAHVIGHREAPEHGAAPVAKTCPGTLVDLDRIRTLLDERLRTSG